MATLIAAQSGATVVCAHCRVTLALPIGRFSALCPQCGFLVTLPTLPPLSHPQSPGTPAPEAPPPPAATTHAPLQPGQISAAPAVNASEATEDQNPDLPTRRPSANRIERTGTFNHRPLELSDIPDRRLGFEREDSKEVSPPAQAINRKAKILGAVAAALFLVLAIVVLSVLLKRDGRRQQTSPHAVPIPIGELRETLGKGALEVLQAAFGTRDPAAIAAHLTGGEELVPAVEARLKDTTPFPSFSEADLVSSISLNEADLRRGFYAMLYQAAQDIMSLDRPLIPSGMARGVEGFTLLEGAAVIEGRSAPAPRRALAFFIKRQGRQLLDWELFLQTWDRTLIAFSDGALGDGPMTFRVMLSFDKAVFENGEFAGETIIRVQDPLHASDVIRVRSARFDPAEILLRPSAADLEKDPNTAMKPRNATVSLTRDGDTGKVSIEEIICWEFLGLGGVEGNTGS